MILALAVKLIATALVVIGVTLAVARVGPRLGGILAGTPIILGPGYFFMLQERPVDFVQSAALSTLHALIATLLFAGVFVLSAGRWGILVTLALATACWIPAAFAFAEMPGGVAGALVVYLLVLLAVEVLRRSLGLGAVAVKVRSGWWDLLLRGLLAGVLVSIATTVAARSGPLLSGVLVGFPVGLFTIGWTLYERYGADVARATISLAQKGMLSLVAFAVTVSVTVQHLAPGWVFVAALSASLAVSAGLYLASEWQYRQRLKTGVAP
ncbi:MAG TPA: hypothetical protein VFM78_04315 [Marinobacter sp.]|nr:hypothetical protein [Marinobacter sp.]